MRDRRTRTGYEDMTWFTWCRCALGSYEWASSDIVHALGVCNIPRREGILSEDAFWRRSSKNTLGASARRKALDNMI
jgi:hypothetical protein